MSTSAPQAYAQANPATKELDNLYMQARSARRFLEPEWFLDLAFYQNEQWLRWTGTQLQRPELGPNRITVVENRIAGCVRTELAKMTKNRPVWTVTPNTGDEEDANAADLAERVMRFQWQNLKMHELALKALEWSRICGAGFLKCYWDKTIGDQLQVLVGPDGQILTDPTGKPMQGDAQAAAMFSAQMGAPVKSQAISQGDIKVEVRSPFQMFVDPMCDSFQDAEWVIEESVKSLEYAKQRFGDAASTLTADTPANPGMIRARMLGSTVGAGAGTAYKGVKIREYWCKPGTKYPNGCRTVWCQGKILVSDQNPFDALPYVMLTGVPVPGRLWPMSVVELLRGPQTELNKVRSQMAENRNRLGNPTLLASKQAVQNPEKFEDSATIPGGVYYYDGVWGPDALPRYLEPPSLPEYVTDEVERFEKAIEDISGQHEVTNANVPPGVTAASAISLLQEADDTRLGLAMQDYEEQLGRFGCKILDLVANFYSDARTIKIAGDDGAWEIFDFRGAQMRGNTHVEVQAGSAFPQSKAAKQAMIQDWMTFFVQSGNPPKGRQLAQFLRDSGMGASDRLVQEYSSTEQQVNRENAKLSLGMQLPINTYDDDQGHVDGHEEFQREARYSQFAPQIQEICEQHVDLHRQRISQQQQQQLQMQLQMAGQVPPGLSQAAFQDEQQLSQLQGVQQVQGTAQQQGFQQAAQEQSQRQAEEKHSGGVLTVAQQNRMALEKHHQQMQHAEEKHQRQLELIGRQAQQRNGGGQGGR